MRQSTKHFLVAICAFAGVFILASFGTSIQNCLVSSYYPKTQIWYGCYQGKKDTVVNATTDSFKLECDCSPTSVAFTTDVLKVAGSPSVSVACYVSANGGATYATAAITAFTSIPTSTVTPVTTVYIVNPSFGGNPYTNYLWVATNTAASTMSWRGSVTLKQ